MTPFKAIFIKAVFNRLSLVVLLALIFFYNNVYAESKNQTYQPQASLTPIVIPKTQSVITSPSVHYFKPFASRLKTVIQHYETIERAGGWPIVTIDKSLKLGVRSVKVNQVIRRMMVESQSPFNFSFCLEGEENCEYDEVVQTLVMDFQHRHGLTIDGVVGPQTAAALNVPVQERLRTLRLNLARYQQVEEKLASDEYVLVNIPEFKLRYIAKGGLQLMKRVVVGKPTWETPSMSDTIESFVVNPTWRVPPSIVADSLIDKVLEDPDYLTEKNYVLKDGSYFADDTVDVDSINWDEISPNNFDYFVVKQPGPKNPLGRIKYLFPNKDAIYVHDTPAKSLFEQAKRSASHGCIRMEDPFSLALNLADKTDRQKALSVLKEAQKQSETMKVRLSNPIPIHLVYWTAWVDNKGKTHFRKDIYDRDDKEIVSQPLLADAGDIK